jgi:hypothetical protein
LESALLLVLFIHEYFRGKNQSHRRIVCAVLLNLLRFFALRMPTVPGVFFQSAMTSATAGSSGSTGLTIRSGWLAATVYAAGDAANAQTPRGLKMIGINHVS